MNDKLNIIRLIQGFNNYYLLSAFIMQWSCNCE